MSIRYSGVLIVQHETFPERELLVALSDGMLLMYEQSDSLSIAFRFTESSELANTLTSSRKVFCVCDLEGCRIQVFCDTKKDDDNTKSYGLAILHPHRSAFCLSGVSHSEARAWLRVMGAMSKEGYDTSNVHMIDGEDELAMVESWRALKADMLEQTKEQQMKLSALEADVVVLQAQEGELQETIKQLEAALLKEKVKVDAAMTEDTDNVSRTQALKAQASAEQMALLQLSNVGSSFFKKVQNTSLDHLRSLGLSNVSLTEKEEEHADSIDTSFGAPARDEQLLQLSTDTLAKLSTFSETHLFGHDEVKNDLHVCAQMLLKLNIEKRELINSYHADILAQTQTMLQLHEEEKRT